MTDSQFYLVWILLAITVFTAINQNVDNNIEERTRVRTPRIRVRRETSK